MTNSRASHSKTRNSGGFTGTHTCTAGASDTFGNTTATSDTFANANLAATTPRTPAHETSRFEAKRAAGNLPDDMWETYSAFANTDGGTIALGLEERPDKTYAARGVKNASHLLKLFWDAVNNPSKVSANVLTNSDVEVVATRAWGAQGGEGVTGGPLAGARAAGAGAGTGGGAMNAATSAGAGASDTFDTSNTSDTLGTLLGANEPAVILIHVPRAKREDKPVFVKNNPYTGTFRRNGEGDYRCSKREVDAMIRDNAPEPQDRALVTSLGLDALNFDTVARWRRALSARKPSHPWLTVSTEDLLYRLGAAGRERGQAQLHPTQAGLLMFGQEYCITQEFPEYFLDFRAQWQNARWDVRVTSDSGDWSGNLFDFWLRVTEQFALAAESAAAGTAGATAAGGGAAGGGLAAANTSAFALDARGTRVGTNALVEALREALANCLIHADYHGARYVVVRQAPTRCDFANPGAMRVPAAVALAGGTSDARNPTLMKMFALVGACEKAGSGLDAICQAAAAARVPAPALTEEFGPDRTRLTIFLQAQSALGAAQGGEGVTGAAASTAGTSSGEGAPARYQAYQAAGQDGAVLFDALVAGGAVGVSRAQLEAATGFSAGKTKRLLRVLVEAGAIMKQGQARATTYTAARK